MGLGDNMSKITFSTKEIKALQKNPNVQRVSERAITYTDSFKNKFMDEYLIEGSHYTGPRYQNLV